MEFYGQEYWNGLPFPFPGDLPNPGMEPGSPALQADSLPTEPPGKPGIKVTPYSSVRNPSVVTSCPQEQAPWRTWHRFLPIILELAPREVVPLHHTDEEVG